MKFKSHLLTAFIFLYASGVLDFANGDEFDFKVNAGIKDMHTGKSISNVPVTLNKLSSNGEWILIEKRMTVDGLVEKFRSTFTEFTAGTYKLQYSMKEYYESAGIKTFFPLIEITFFVDDTSKITAIVVQPSAYAYTTYRGFYD